MLSVQLWPVGAVGCRGVWPWSCLGGRLHKRAGSERRYLQQSLGNGDNSSLDQAQAQTGCGIYLYNTTGVCDTAEPNKQWFPAPGLVLGIR